MRIIILIACFVLSSCGYVESTLDEVSYKSITGRTGTVKLMVAGQPVEYKNAKVKYSETNSSTILITTESGIDVYIQGPVVIEFNN